MTRIGRDAGRACIAASTVGTGCIDNSWFVRHCLIEFAVLKGTIGNQRSIGDRREIRDGGKVGRNIGWDVRGSIGAVRAGDRNVGAYEI